MERAEGKPRPRSRPTPAVDPTPPRTHARPAPCLSQVTAEIFRMVERHYAIPRAVIFRSEFSVYVELSFRLQLEPSEVYPHFVRLLQALERTPHEYLGEAHFQNYYAEFLRPRAEASEAEPVAEPEAAFNER